MAGVVDEVQAGGAVGGGDPGRQHQVLGGLAGVEAGDPEAALVVAVVPVGGHAAAATGVADDGLLQILQGFPREGAEGSLEPGQVGLDVLASGQGDAVGQEEAGGMGVGEGDEDAVPVDAGGSHQVRHHLVGLFVGEQHEVELHAQDSLLRASHGLQDQHVRLQGPVHAGGAVVAGGAPHAVVDAHRRRHVAMGVTDAQHRRGRGHERRRHEASTCGGGSTVAIACEGGPP